MPMRREFRLWRGELAGKMRKVRALARDGHCPEAKRLFKEAFRESGTSLVGWDTWIRLGNEVSRRCKRKRAK
jgi:hypothetical protein